MKNTSLLFFILWSGYTTLWSQTPQAAPCNFEQLFQEGKVFSEQENYPQALKKFNSARRCNPDKGTLIDTEIQKVFDGIQRQKEEALRQRDQAERAKKEADRLKLLAEQQSREVALKSKEIQKNTLVSLASSLLNNRRYNEALRNALEAFKIERAGEVEKLIFQAYAETQKPGGYFLEQVSQAHKAAVYRIDMPPTEAWVISASTDSTVHLWTIEGALIQKITGLSGTITDLAFSPNGKRFVTVTSDEKAMLWNDKGEPIANLPILWYNDQSKFEFSPDNKFLLYHNGFTGKVWNAAGALIIDASDKEKPVFYEETSNARFFNHSGLLILTQDAKGAVRSWDIHGKEVKLLDTLLIQQAMNSRSQASKPNPGLTATLSYDADGSEGVWLSDGTKPFAEDSIHLVPIRRDAPISAMALAKNKGILWIGTTTGETSVWHFQKKIGAEIPLKSDGMALFAPDAQFFITFESPFYSNIRDMKGEKLNQHPILHFDPTPILNGQCFSSNGEFFLSYSQAFLNVWNKKGQLEQYRTFNAHIQKALFFRDDRSLLVLCSKSLQLIHLNSEETAEYPVSIPIAEILPARLSDKIFLQFADSTLQILDHKLSIIKNPGYPQQGILNIKLSGNGSLIHFILNGGWQEIWTTEGKLLLRINNPKAIDIASDGRLIAVSKADGKLELHSEGAVKNVAGINHADQLFFSEDGAFLFASANGGEKIAIYKINGQRVFYQEHAPKSLLSASFSPKGNLFACSFDDSRVEIYTLSGKLVKSIPVFASCSFSPAGNYLVLQRNYDYTVLNEQGEEIFQTKHETPTMLQFSAKDHYYLTTELSKKIQFSPTPIGLLSILSD